MALLDQTLYSDLVNILFFQQSGKCVRNERLHIFSHVSPLWIYVIKIMMPGPNLHNDPDITILVYLYFLHKWRIIGNGKSKVIRHFKGVPDGVHNIGNLPGVA